MLISRILDRLEISPNDVIFLHSSQRYLSYLGMSPSEIIRTLMDRIGPRGTLVMPSYAWHLDKNYRPWKGYLDYFLTAPVFDVRNTPSSLGIITESFRQMPDVRRSLSYWWSICAAGEFSEVLTANQDAIEQPYGPGSSFDLLRLHKAKILGLGVSLNTTSLAPIVDYMLGTEHCKRVFTSVPHIGTMLSATNQKLQSSCYTLKPEVVRKIKPQRMIEESALLRSSILRADFGQSIHFCYRYEVYHSEALRIGLESTAKGQTVPWLSAPATLTNKD